MGEQVDATVEKNGQAEDLSSPNGSGDESEDAPAGEPEAGKTKPIDSPAVDLSKMEDRFQTIDFTSIDTGKLGHKIPVKIMCSVTNTGLPGDGWKLVHETNFKGTKIARAIDKVTDIDDPELKWDNAENGYFLLVNLNPPPIRPVRNVTKKLIPRRLKNKDWTLK